MENPKDFIKLDRFDGINFTRWKDKMIFLKIHYILNSQTIDLSSLTHEDSDAIKVERKEREDDELLCHGHILNTLTDHLYNLFSTLKTTKEIWNTLQTAY